MYKGLIQNDNINKNNLYYGEFQSGDLNINLSQNGAKKMNQNMLQLNY